MSEFRIDRRDTGDNSLARTSPYLPARLLLTRFVNLLLLHHLKQESITSPLLLCFIRVVFGMGQPLMAVAFRFMVLLFMGVFHQVFQFVGRIAEIFGF